MVRNFFQSRGSQNSIRWSPDGSQIAFASSRGDHGYIGVCNVATKSIKFLDSSVDSDVDSVWSPDGKFLAFIKIPYAKDALMFGPEKERNPWTIRSVNVETGKSSELWKAKAGRGSAFFENGIVGENRLFWTANNQIIFGYEGTGWHHLYSISANGGEVKLLSPNDGETEYVTLSADKNSIIYNANIGDIERRHTWQVSPFYGIIKQLTKGQGIEWSPVQLPNGQVFCLHSDARTPARPCMIQADGKMKDLALELISSDFPSSQLVQPQAVMVTAKDGMKIPAQLFLPKNHKSGDKYPAAIFFHGGSRRQMLLGFNYSDYYHKAYALNRATAPE